MRIVFAQVFADAADHYVRERLKRGFRAASAGGPADDDAHLNEQVANVVRGQLGARVPVVSPDALGEAASAHEAEIEARKRCALAMVMRQWPLLGGEVVEEDFFTFLHSPYGDLPAQTAVLRRKTNQAELYYLFDEVRVADGSLVFVEPPPVPRAALALKGGKESLAATLGKSLASGIVSGFGGKIGALIFDAIFPPGVPEYFDEVYQEIRNIVRQELSAQLIEQISGRVNGTVAWVRKTYAPRKASGAPREELLSMVSEYVNSFYRDAVYTLMEPQHTKPGFPVFLLAAGLHMALMQEQALVDPRQPDPNKSSYATSVRLSAQEYHDQAIKAFDEIVRQRGEAVQIRDRSRKTCVQHSCTTTYIYQWVDTVNNREGALFQTYTGLNKEAHDGMKDAEADRQHYVADVIRDLTSELGDPKAIAATWLKLKEHPIPAA